MSESRITVLSYFMVLIGYMTITLSLPLAGLRLDGLSSTVFQYGVALSFFMFSVSAIVLSRLTDFLGAYTVLKFAQPISILGLILLACFHNAMIVLGAFFLLGLGTGCYSSISRSLIAQHTRTAEQMRKRFANFSLIFMTGPLISARISLSFVGSNWHMAYWIMAAIEVLLLVGVWFVLHGMTVQTHSIRLKTIWQGYAYCLAKRQYWTNMIIVGVVVALIINVLAGNALQLFNQQYHFSSTMISLALPAVIITYLIGIVLFRVLSNRVPLLWLRVAAMSMLMLGVVVFSCSSTTGSVLASLYLMCVALGMLSPMSTSHGMLVIDKNHGAAAALFTFAFALVSGMWSLVRAWTTLSPHAFIALAVLISWLVMTGLLFMRK